MEGRRSRSLCFPAVRRLPDRSDHPMDATGRNESTQSLNSPSYARTRVRSGSNVANSYPFKEGARATKAEVAERVRNIPTPGEWIGDGFSLDDLAAIYSRVTGRAVE